MTAPQQTAKTRVCSGTVCYTFENAPQTFTHGANSNLAQCSVVSIGGCPEVLRRPSRTQTDSMHVKLRLLLNAHEIYIGYTAAKKLLRDSEMERLEIKNTRLHHFANARNLILRFRRLLHFGNLLNRIQFRTISQMYGTRFSVS